MAITVRELIEQLQQVQDPDATVQFYTYDDYQDEPVMWMPVEIIEAATAVEGDGDLPGGTSVLRLR